MKTRLLLVWAAAWSLGRDLVDRFRPLDQTELFTEDDRTFVDEIRAVAPADLDPSAVDESTPIFDVLTAEWPALYARRLRALRWPTAEIEVQWRGLTSMLALDWMCQHCAVDQHADCPSCSCSCSMAVTA